MVEYNKEIQLKDILIKFSEYKELLLKKKLPIFLITLLCVILGVFFAINSDVRYNAELTFVVEGDQGPNTSSMSGIASQFGFDIGGPSSSTFSQQNILELLKSRVVVEATLMQNGVVNRKNDLLIEHYLNINRFKEDWDSDLMSLSFNGKLTKTHDSISGGICRGISEERLLIELKSDESNLISLSFLSLNEEFSKQFVEGLIRQMSKMYVTHQTAQATKTLDFLEGRADSVFAELEFAEEEFARVKDINKRIIKASGRLKELQLMRRVEVLNAMYLEIIKNLEISKITLLNNTPIIQIIDKPILPLQEDKLSISLLAVLGAFIGSFLSLIFFVCQKLFKDALAE